MRKVLGQKPRQVLCHAWNPPWSKFAHPACAAATISFDGGTVVNYRGSIVSTGPTTPWADEWHMECAGGSVIWTSHADTVLPDRVAIRPFGKEPYSVELPELPYTDRA